MFKNIFNDPLKKDLSVKIIAVIIIIAVVLLSFDVFTQNKDGRRQLVDEDGGVEVELCEILSDIEGVGDVDVMLQYDREENITGAIITAEGADNPVVKNNIVNAVMALFGITATGVEVFEKSSVVINEEEMSNEEQN